MEITQIKYDINKPVGEKTEGKQVFHGTFQDRAVAVKILFINEEKEKKRFENEIKALTKCESYRSNVVRYFYWENCPKHPDRVLMAVEPCKASLEDWLKDPIIQQSLPEVTTIGLLRQISSGLSEVHDRRIIHGNLKPENILLTVYENQTVVKLSDFGFSKFLSEGTSSTRPTGSAINDKWSAKEILDFIDMQQNTGNENEATNRTIIKMSRSSDIFSLGCIFYYVVTKGKHPFGSRDTERRKNIQTSDPQIVIQTTVNVPHGILSLISAMISSNRDYRPAARDVMQHHVFWSNKMRLLFLVDVSNTCEKPSANASDCMNTTEKAHEGIICKNRDGWLTKIDDPLKEYLKTRQEERDWVYNGKFVKDLIRAIRNTHNHWGSHLPNIQEQVGNIPDNFISFWIELFPELVDHVWMSFQPLANELSDGYYPQHYKFYKFYK